MKQIASFDLDMTLLDHKTWKIPDSALMAIEALRKTHWIVLATGRDMDQAISRALRDQLAPDAIIHLNGTKITVGSKLIYEHFFDKRILEQLLDYAKGKTFSIGATINGVDYHTNPEKVTSHDMNFWGSSHRHFADAGLLTELPVRTLAYIGDRQTARNIEQCFPQVRLPMFAGNQGADLIETDSSKAEGLKQLCQYFCCDIKSCIAFGDSMNDYEIIKAAGIGVAMGNAIEELKKAADYITTAIDEDGIRNACLYLHLI